jgi:hypothetical protein
MPALCLAFRVQGLGANKRRFFSNVQPWAGRARSGSQYALNPSDWFVELATGLSTKIEYVFQNPDVWVFRHWSMM